MNCGSTLVKNAPIFGLARSLSRPWRNPPRALRVPRLACPGVACEPPRPAARSAWLEHVAQRWAAQVVGQPQAADSILRLLQRIEAQACQARRTMGSVLLLGPPGCGKTHSVEALAEVLLGSSSALLKIN